MKQNELSRLEKTLREAILIDENKLADEIKYIGFKCRRCSRCCREEFGDNTVAIFPFEIKKICRIHGLKWREIVLPAPSQDVDPEGNIHTFEWVLRKKEDCIFLENGLCKIYGCRPYICRTYPFYLLDGKLMVSECGGIGCPISSKDSIKIALLLKERYIAEIKESISLLGKFRGFKPGGKGNVCVHDSEGEHWMANDADRNR
ncbi:MAG: YkgJ family cysteine cluster protein [Candidatus Methanoperedens sp.]|nr:YkgJ family cysteine cluster protein [Candidatus Methanoperedens sp.]